MYRQSDTTDLITCGGTAVGTIVAHVQRAGDQFAAAVACYIRVRRLEWQGICESPARYAFLYERGLASRRRRELRLPVVRERKLTDVTANPARVI